MNQPEFEAVLTDVCDRLTEEAAASPFGAAKGFEDRVRQLLDVYVKPHGLEVDYDPHPHAFPDISIGRYGVEVKHTLKDTWRSVANSVLESRREGGVQHVYVMFGKMGGSPEVRWSVYERSVIHVRTSHVPRFELELGTKEPLFVKLGVSYDEFRKLPIHEKMRHIRNYARSRLKAGERLWWLEDRTEDGAETHTLPLQARLYTKLPAEEKRRLRAEGVVLCPEVLGSSRRRDKYDDMVLFLLTYHGVLCHQARDLFSAGSVAMRTDPTRGGIYIMRSVMDIEQEILEAAERMADELFVEYWGTSVTPQNRVAKWLQKADEHAEGWKPSEVLFQHRE